MKLAAIIFARYTSARLPGKVMMSINGKPMLHHVIERAKKLPGVSDIVLAIPYGDVHSKLIDVGTESDIYVVQGPEHDVLTRMVMATGVVDCEAFYRVTADNPLLDLGIARITFNQFVFGVHDYTFMDKAVAGCAVEIIDRDAILRVQDGFATDDRLREHPTLSFYENRDIFNLLIHEAPVNWQRPFRLTVDTPEDLTVVRAVYRNCGSDCDISTAIEFLEANPKLAAINSEIPQQAKIG